MKNKLRFVSINTIWGTIMLIIVSFILILSIVIVQLKLVESADNLGLSLVKSYANEEEYKLHTYENMLLFATQSINDLDKSNEDNSQEIQ